jgi:hypothetical protein
VNSEQARVNIFVHQAKGLYWAYCPELDLVASGATAEEARSACVELVDEALQQVKRHPGDADPFQDEEQDWDAILLSAASDKTRTLN